MIQKNYRAPLLYYIKLCATFQSHQWIQTGVTVRKHSIRVNIRDFLFRLTLKFDGLPSTTMRHLFYTTLSFVHHFKTIGEFKLELQSGNFRFGSKLAIFFYPCDLEIWQMTLKNNRAPLLCNFKLWVLFRSHWWIKLSYSPEMPNLGQNQRFLPSALQAGGVLLSRSRQAAVRLAEPISL